MQRSKWGKQKGPLNRKPRDFRTLAASVTVKPGAEVYRSWKWRKLSRELREQQPYCSQCGSKDELTVDHKTGLAELGPNPADHPLAYDPSNLTVLCRSCHAALENQRRRDRTTTTGIAEQISKQASWLDE